MKSFQLFTFLLAFFSVLSCSEDDTSFDPENDGPAESKYVFVAQSIGSEGIETSNYIIAAKDITQGELSIKNGIETDAYSFFTQNNTLFASVYGTGGAGQGPITPYRLQSDGGIYKVGYKLNALTVAVHGNFNESEVVCGSFSGQLYRLDAVNLKIAGRGQLDFKKLEINNEKPEWHGIFQVGQDKMFVPYSMGLDNGDSKLRDSTWIAVVNYPELTLKKVISDGRTGTVGAWFGQQGVQQVADGDTYVFSTAEKSKNPSAIIRINKDQEEFDQSYFFDVEKATNGHKLSRAEYIGGTTFLVSFFTDKQIENTWDGETRLAIVDVKTQKIQWVKGLPDHPQMWYRQKVYVEKDQQTIHYVFKDLAMSNTFHVFAIDAKTAQATKGITIKNVQNVTAITKLDVFKN